MLGYWSTAGVAMAAMTPVLAVLAWWATRQRPARAGRSLALSISALAWWSLGHALELSGHTLEAVQFWGDIKFLGVLLVPPTWLLFVLQYTEHDDLLPGRRRLLLLIHPLTVVTLLVIPATHDLIRYYPADLQPGRDVPVAISGPLFWPHVVYVYLVMATGAYLLIRTTLRAAPAYRRQGWVVAAAVAVSFASNGAYVFGIEPFDKVDVTPYALLIMSVVLLWGVLRHGLVPIVPVARHAVVERMTDGVVVLDGYHRVLDLNPAAQRLLGLSADEGKGLPATALLPVDDLLDGQQPGDRSIEAELGPPGDTRHYDMVLSPLQDGAGRRGGHVLVLRDITDRKRAEAYLARLSMSDQLTGLANRKHLHERLAELASEGRDFTLLFCDLDRFKRINDTLGHDVGDRVLIEIAERLQQVTPAEGLVARLGGDEFVVVVADTDGESAAVAARHVVAAVAKPLPVSGHELYLTTSVGVCRSPERGRDPATLLRLADLAMYRAKARGGNRVAYHVDRVQEERLDRLQLERDLHAFRHDELELWYQPITSLADGRCTGLEALLRWRHPRRGLLQPDLFLPVAEQSDLMGSLGHWVLDVACTQAVRWRELPGPWHIAVNVSARQFEPSFARRVARVLDRTGLEPATLTLEITETAVLQGGDETLRILKDIKALGVRLATDDFGTGYTSLEQLRKFPLDVLKIDRSYVMGLNRRPEDASIVGGVIRLAHDLGLNVVAEGVETVAQRDLLRELDCDEAQGFLFSEPLPPVRAAAYLTRPNRPAPEGYR